MTVVLLGYRSTKRNAVPEPLYVGNSAAEAREAQDAPPAGIVRTELFQGIEPDRVRHHSGEVAKPAAPVKPPAKDKDPKPDAAKDEKPKDAKGK
jgi:hypothetical protein